MIIKKKSGLSKNYLDLAYLSLDLTTKYWVGGPNPPPNLARARNILKTALTPRCFYAGRSQKQKKIQ